MKTTTLPEHPDAKSSAGADIRFLMDGETGSMIHSTGPPHQKNNLKLLISMGYGSQRFDQVWSQETAPSHNRPTKLSWFWLLGLPL
jgi:hypothetical protein